MVDRVFGDLEYNGGWSKKEKILFWGKVQEVRIVVSAYENEVPNCVQQDAYKRFLEDCEEISRIGLKKLKEYLSMIEDDILLYCGIKKMPDDVFEVLSINQILFLESGTFAILCDAKWDDHGIAVIYTETEVKAGPQDMVWME